jgi:hypothetical protein
MSIQIAVPATHRLGAVRRATLLTAGLTLACGAWAQSAPYLSFSSSAQVYGYLNAQYSSPLLGNVSFTLYGPSDYKYSYGGAGGASTGLASVDYSIATGFGGSDPVYDIVTSSGQYGFSYSGRAEVDGLSLHTKMTVGTVDNAGNAVANTPNANVYAYSSGSWNQQFYIAPTAARPAGSYGAILVGYTLDGGFSGTGSGTLGSAYGQLTAQSNFTDASGGNFQSSYSVYANSYGGPSVNTTQYEKLLFQFGTPFSLNLYQYAGASVNGTSDFFNTGRISSIEIPFEATLLSGAEQAGLGAAANLYGSLTNSATADDINTNWDFGNNGGGFVPPPVPEPRAAALWCAGLAMLGFMAKRRRR